MEKMAVPTGDVVKDMDVNREEYLFFLLKNKTNEFAIGLGDASNVQKNRGKYRNCHRNGGGK